VSFVVLVRNTNTRFRMFLGYLEGDHGEIKEFASAAEARRVAQASLKRAMRFQVVELSI
jgi:hypothetical protein